MYRLFWGNEGICDSFTEARSDEVNKDISPRCLKVTYLLFTYRGFLCSDRGILGGNIIEGILNIFPSKNKGNRVMWKITRDYFLDFGTGWNELMVRTSIYQFFMGASTQHERPRLLNIQYGKHGHNRPLSAESMLTNLTADVWHACV